MALFHFPGQAVLANDAILENAVGGTFVDENGASIPIYDLNDNPITEITSNAFGQSSTFKADVPAGYIKFGEILNWVFSTAVVEFALNAQSAIDIANSAATQAQQAALAVSQLEAAGGALPTGGTPDVDILWRGPTERSGVWAPAPATTGGSGIVGAPATWPQSFPADPHTHTASELRRIVGTAREPLSAVVLALLGASTDAAARSAIGAGVPVTGFPGFGTDNVTAARGDHTHTATAVGFTPAAGIQADNVQAALVNLAGKIGTGGTSTGPTIELVYSGGSYEALPATKPAGIRRINSVGPVAPIQVAGWVMPSWVGRGAGQVPMAYDYLDIS